MKDYKLTETEARALAAKTADKFHNPNISNPNFDSWAEDYMRTFNKVMNSLEKYTD